MSETALIELRKAVYELTDLRGVELDAAIGRAISGLVRTPQFKTDDETGERRRVHLAYIGDLPHVVRLVGEVAPTDSRFYMWENECLWHDTGMSTPQLLRLKQLIDDELQRRRT